MIKSDLKDRYRVSYAQNREDIILRGFFEGVENGFYVDVGANHPDELSVTKIFYEDGWSGINIEPNPVLFRLLSDDRSRDTNLNIGISDMTGTLKLRTYPDGDGLSTFSPDVQEEYQEDKSEYNKFTKDFTDIEVPVDTLKNIFEKYAPQTIHFMNVDVEGFEYNVLKGNDWEKYRPQAICIESNHIRDDWRPLLAGARYTLVFYDGLNNYYVADEHHELISNFSYAKSILIPGPIVSAGVASEFKQAREDYLALEDRLAQHAMTIQNLQDEVKRLNGHIAEQNRLRSSIKHLAFVVDNIIMLNIEKLNRPVKPTFRPIKLSSDHASASELCNTLRRYDIETYYNLRRNSDLLYRIVRKSYKLLRKGVVVVLRAGYKLVKRNLGK